MSNYDKIPSYSMRTYYLMNTIESTLRLTNSCLINGLVYDETDQLLLALEDISESQLNSDDKLFKELMALRTLNWNLPNGFTIGGLMPLKRTTLLSVVKIYLD